MDARHFAYFDQASGRCVREAQVPVRPRAWLRVAAAWLWQLLHGRVLAFGDAAATVLSEPRRGEVGLDVTRLGYPLGDFVWSRFDAEDRTLSFPAERHFITIRRDDGFVCGNVLTARPVRPPSDPALAVLDVTGLGLANDGPWIHGWLDRETGTVRPLVAAPQAALPAAEPTVEWDLARVREAVVVE